RYFADGADVSAAGTDQVSEDDAAGGFDCDLSAGYADAADSGLYIGSCSDRGGGERQARLAFDAGRFLSRQLDAGAVAADHFARRHAGDGAVSGGVSGT